uniref:AlNc14C259G9785 protein n=1 Tax=Albugo laibachii Nc14 TaxID=890382 RepID=F0WTW0_9STRA|nr:AlNc14C259G9785 [Albugo laibachii Nc14]|eukprot:CCA24804.1 AlNc14C259G9785 [Albugo laibachii Nc14]
MKKLLFKLCNFALTMFDVSVKDSCCVFVADVVKHAKFAQKLSKHEKPFVYSIYPATPYPKESFSLISALCY